MLLGMFQWCLSAAFNQVAWLSPDAYRAGVDTLMKSVGVNVWDYVIITISVPPPLFNTTPG